MSAQRLPGPDVVDTVPAEELPAFMAELGALSYRAAARLAAEHPGPAEATEQLLTVEQVAERLAATVDWLRRQRDLPFRVELSGGMVRYSAAGLDRWVRERTGRR